MSRFAIVRLLAGAYSFAIRAASGITANQEWVLPPSLPTTGQSIRAQAVASGVVTLEYYTPSTGTGTGTVTSVDLSAPTNEFAVSGNPVTGSGTLALAWKNQTAALVLASPASATGIPTFRALVASDIPNHDANKITSGVFDINRIPVGTAAGTVAAGNDTRFHTQNTDTSTTAQSFQLQSGASGVRIKNNAGVLEARNAADSAYVDLVVNNITVQGTQTIINSNTVNIGDNILTLNSDYVGASPSENGGLEIQRGTQTNASFIWDESTDFWKAGLLGAEAGLARLYITSFTSASLSSGVLTVTHNLGRQFVQWSVYDNANQAVFPEIVATSSNGMTMNFANATVTGTWNLVICG